MGKVPLVYSCFTFSLSFSKQTVLFLCREIKEERTCYVAGSRLGEVETERKKMNARMGGDKSLRDKIRVEKNRGKGFCWNCVVSFVFVACSYISSEGI